MRVPLLEMLSRKVLLGDGAMGTMLQSAGMTHGECPEKWNIAKPDVVERIHRTYLEAGSDLIITNTFGANRIKLQRYALENELEAFNKTGAQVARKAAGESRYVLGDIGPSGGLLQPYGELDPEKVQQSFYEQAKALASEDIDGIVIETMSDLEEMLLAVRAATTATDLPVVTSMTYQVSKEMHRTMMGQKTVDCALALKEAGASVIGANCGVGVREMLAIVKEFNSVKTGLPLMAQPNAGLPIMEGGQTIYPESPEEMAEFIKDFLANEVRILGGCCGTTMDHIRAFRETLDDLTT